MPSPFFQTQLLGYLMDEWPVERYHFSLLFAPGSRIYAAFILGCHRTGLGLGEGRRQTLLDPFIQQPRQWGVWAMSVTAEATSTKDLWHFLGSCQMALWLEWGLSEEESKRWAWGGLRCLPGESWEGLGSF